MDVVRRVRVFDLDLDFDVVFDGNLNVDMDKSR
jgi:hypothetical protein